jgi:hypothetical protein
VNISLLNRKWFRKASAVAIFAAAALAQLFFKNIPWPLNIDQVENLHTASASLGSQEIVLGNATVSPHRNFLAYDGGDSETVDLDFDRAQLGPATNALLSSFPPAPPSAPSPWHFVTHEDTAASDNCRSFLNIDPPERAGNEFHFLQLGQPGLDHARQFELRTDAAPLVLNVKTEWPEGRENKAVGCHKRLQSGDWFRGIVNTPVQFVASPHSSIRINVVALPPHVPWHANKPIQSMQLGPLLAKEITLRPIQDDGTVAKAPADLHLSAYRDSHLKVSNFIVGSDTLQIAVSGRAWAQLGGKTQGLDLWDAMQKNPLLATVLGSANVVLLAWLRKLFFNTGAASPPVPAGTGA